MMGYVFLGIAALLPVIAAVIMKLVTKTDKFKKIPYKWQQLIIGVVFGLLAVVGTEWGIKANGAIVNARDAAPIIAGLTFGLPAGIIAGVIGGVERWFAVYWGAGSFTRIACSVSTIISGLGAGLARKFMFQDKRVYPTMSFVVGYVLETFHLAMVFYTNVGTPIQALRVVEACAIPMILANSISVFLSSVAIDIVKINTKGKKKQVASKLAISMQKRFLSAIGIGLLFSYMFMFTLQNVISTNQRESLLDNAISSIQNDIRDESNANMLEVARKAKDDVGTLSLTDIIAKYDIAEIHIINKQGIIVESSIGSLVGFDMTVGEQSNEFMCLVDDASGITEFVQDYMPTASDPNISRKYAGIKIDTGFIQIAYNYEQFRDNVSKNIVGITRNSHVGETGFMIIVDQSLNVVSAPDGLNFAGLLETFANIDKVKANKTFEGVFNNEDYFIKYSTSEGYSIVAFITVENVYQSRNIALYAGFFNEIIILGVVYSVIYLLLERRVVKNIDIVNASLNKITKGDLNEKIDVKDSMEFIQLSKNINHTVKAMKDYIKEAETRIDEELKFAKNIQSSSLPIPYPMFSKYKSFDIAAYMGTAKEVGGDFYDFYVVDNNINFLVADVSGKGIPAAMFMMRAKTELKSLSESGMYISDVFTNANKELCTGNDAGMFVTAWQGKLDLANGTLWFVNAGHNHPLVKKKDGKFEYLKSKPNFILAGMDGMKYRAETAQLDPGDIIFLYTDGVTEATNSESELFGEERLQNFLNSKEFITTEEICESVKKELDKFVGDAPQFDDITMVCLRYNGDRKVPKILFEGATLDDIPQVTEFVEAELEKHEVPMKIQMQMSVAIDEIFSNIVRYAYGPGMRGIAVVFVDVNEEERCIKITFEDGGMPYNPLKKEDPDVTLSAEDRQIGGLGIYMVKQSMDDIDYRYEHKLNILTLYKKY